MSTPEAPKIQRKAESKDSFGVLGDFLGGLGGEKGIP
jgi:hypothetical protein